MMIGKRESRPRNHCGLCFLYTRKPTKELSYIFLWGGVVQTKTIGPACLLIFDRMSGVSRQHLRKYIYKTAETTDDFLFRLLCAVCYVSWLV
jgi:hypothetical protein